MEIFIKRCVFALLFCFHVSYGLAVCQAFFAPDDNLTSLFITHIDAEQKSIYGAIYMLTDKKIAQALVNAKKRGVDVQLIIDQASMGSCGKGRFLQEQGVPVVVHSTLYFNSYTTPLMHHKFFIFSCNKDDVSLLWTGSWNCTVRGTKQNDENVIILDDAVTIQKFYDQFFLMQDRLLAVDE